MFDGYCQINYPAAAKLFDYIMSPEGNVKGNFKVDPYQDTARLIQNYVAKNQDDEYTTVAQQ